MLSTAFIALTSKGKNSLSALVWGNLKSIAFTSGNQVCHNYWSPMVEYLIDKCDLVPIFWVRS